MGNEIGGKPVPDKIGMQSHLTLPWSCGRLDSTLTEAQNGKEVFDVAVFSVKTGKASEEETREARLSQEDLTWWSENSPKLVVEENLGKYVAVVNKEAFFGDTYQEAKKKAKTKYPNRRFIVRRIPSKWGKRI